MSDNLKYWVWLSSIPGMGAVTCKKLLEVFLTPDEIWKSSEALLKKSEILSDSLLGKVLDKNLKKNVNRHIENILKNNIKVINIFDDNYPVYLKGIYDPPVVLFLKGRISREENAIAVVGSRKASSYGLLAAEKIAQEIANCGITVVSGMARGIDSRAHYGALKAKGKTIAVLGCGLDIVYPPENGDLMNKIVQSGAAISEYLPGFPPVQKNFPARNRIISGLSRGVVVIEASEKSGSLITADFALEQGREVFAVPGNIDSYNSQGTNRLIREGAKIVTGIEDILEELKIFSDNCMKNSIKVNMNTDRSFLDGMELNEKIIAQCLWEQELHIDILCKKSGLSMQQVNSILVMLELNGIVEQLPGKIFKVKK